MPGGRTANIFAILVQMMPSGRAVHTAHGAHVLGENWEIGKKGNMGKWEEAGWRAYPQNQC